MRAYIPEHELVVARGLTDALEFLDRGEDWRPIAGGTDLMVLLNAGKLPYKRLVSIKRIPELCSIEVDPDVIAIGAAVTFRQIREHALLRAEFPLLCQAASWTGGIANQNQGTLGGNIVNASPAGDSLPALLVHDAQLRLLSAAGERTIPYTAFHTGYKNLSMNPNELLYKIQLPRRSADWHYHGRKVGTRRAQAISKCCLALAFSVKAKAISDIRIGIGSVAPVPKRCFEAENALRGRMLNAATIARACQMLRNEIAPIDDIRSTARYRAQVAENVLVDFLTNRNDATRVQ